MNNPYQKQLTNAKEILIKNWVGRYTRPSPYFYPHQWNWYSGFIGISYSRYILEKAQQEIRTLFEAQWANGMVPQIVFESTALSGYFPDHEFWQTSKLSQMPNGKLTSGITMPPVHATVCRHIFERAEDKKEAVSFIKTV